MSIVDNDRVENLYGRIAKHIRGARCSVMRAINLEQVKAYWLIGKEIVEEEQQGKQKATYGSYLLQVVSERLTKEFGNGYSLATIKDMRRFYMVYKPIRHAARGESTLEFRSKLGWTHYRSLMRIKNAQARSFYEIEASKNNWSSARASITVVLLINSLNNGVHKNG